MDIKRFTIISAFALVLAACGSTVAEETTPTAPPTTMAMEDNGHEHDHEHGGEGTEWAGSDVPTVEVTVEGDAASGWTVTALIGDSFSFGTPDDTAHQDGVGHAHLVVNGLVRQMLYEPTVTIDDLEPGTNMIEVRLASSDHSDYVHDGEVIAGMAMVEVEGEVAAADVMIHVELADGHAHVDSDRVAVAVGDIVEIMLTTDTDEEIHVHGYDIKVDVAAGTTGTLRFTAEVPGIFEVELEQSRTHILELEVS